MSQEKFLSNDKNKQRLIKMLCVKFQKEGFVMKQAEEKDDYLIIKNSLEIEKGLQSIVVFGEDNYLLVIMAASTNSENIFFLKPERGQGCTNSPDDDNIITNSAKQEAEIDIRMVDIISEVDLEEECQILQVEESENKQTDINDNDSPSTSKKLKFI
ncbi:hypothetical protein AVEN_127836-1 [Araneus ventricosus]|uniref:Uncharacterized protein n=1 Tax=Araneus ventricosus TaxID=182803 RepID=A0A4Y1ZZS4_ARAVE|nr:hypothetical protein AVEN_127836-1 [Araneus ventricosus]